MTRVVKLNEGQLRGVVRSMLREQLGTEFQGKHAKVISMLSTIALHRGAKTLEDVQDDLDEIVAIAERRLGYEPVLVGALDDLVSGEHDLAKKVWSAVSERRGSERQLPSPVGKVLTTEPEAERRHRPGRWEDPRRHPQSSM
jgi:hypothetical protein